MKQKISFFLFKFPLPFLDASKLLFVLDRFVYLPMWPMACSNICLSACMSICLCVCLSPFLTFTFTFYFISNLQLFSKNKYQITLLNWWQNKKIHYFNFSQYYDQLFQSQYNVTTIQNKMVIQKLFLIFLFSFQSLLQRN